MAFALHRKIDRGMPVPRWSVGRIGASNVVQSHHSAVEATLQDIVGTLDATVVDVVFAADELAAAVTEVTFFDRADPRSVHPGAIVLAIGIDAEDGDALGLV